MEKMVKQDFLWDGIFRPFLLHDHCPVFYYRIFIEI